MVTIGTGAGTASDRLTPARRLLAENLDYLVLECLAERTIASAQARHDAGGIGYHPRLADRLRAILGPAATHNTTIVTNAGAAAPTAAGKRAVDVADDLGVELEVVVVTGDDCTTQIKTAQTDETTNRPPDEIVAANAYLGVEELLPAFEQADGTADAQLVIAGRVADPSLFVTPLAYEFDWPLDDWQRLGQATVVGHLLECGAQLTGGYFMEPDRKPVPDPHILGYPFAEVDADGTAVLQKPVGTGGRLDRATCREQLLYEVHDPSAYLTPDVTADFTTVALTEVGPNQVRVTGGTGRERPAEFKVSVGSDAGYRSEAYLMIGGPNAEARARQAKAIVERRIHDVHTPDAPYELRGDVIGVDALYGDAVETPESESAGERPEVELRMVGWSPERAVAQLVPRELGSLWVAGPAACGGLHPEDPDAATTSVIGIDSRFLPRDRVTPQITYQQYTTTTHQ